MCIDLRINRLIKYISPDSGVHKHNINLPFSYSELTIEWEDFEVHNLM